MELAFADVGYQGPCVAASSPIRVEIVRRADEQADFAVIVRRWVGWVVERFLAWTNRNRRLAACLPNARAQRGGRLSCGSGEASYHPQLLLGLTIYSYATEDFFQPQGGAGDL